LEVGRLGEFKTQKYRVREKKNGEEEKEELLLFGLSRKRTPLYEGKSRKWIRKWVKSATFSRREN